MIAPHSPTSTLSSGPLLACSNQPGAKCLGEERGKQSSGVLVCTSNKHLCLAAKKVEAGNNCHPPFRLPCWKRASGRWWLGVGRGVNRLLKGRELRVFWGREVIFYYSSHLKNSLSSADGLQPCAQGARESPGPRICVHW